MLGSGGVSWGLVPQFHSFSMNMLTLFLSTGPVFYGRIRAINTYTDLSYH